MATAPQTPESPEIPEPVEIPLHMIPPHSVQGGKSDLTPVSLRLWLHDGGAAYLEILGAIAGHENADQSLRTAATWLTMDLQTIVRAVHCLKTGEIARFVEASEWSSPVDRQDHLRDLAALASSAGHLFAEADDFGDAWLAYRDLSIELEKRLAEERETKEPKPPPPPTAEELGERLATRSLLKTIRALDWKTRAWVTELSPEELARRLRGEPGNGEGA